jgi:excisionase family DNA binding protein
LAGGKRKMKIYTLEELEQILKIPIFTLRKYLRNGNLRGSKIGKHWRVSEDQLDQFLQDTENRGALKMYLVVELVEGKKRLYESIEQMNEDFKLNNLYTRIENIREIDKQEFNKITEEIILGMGFKRGKK